jgi:hypothetical protein
MALSPGVDVRVNASAAAVDVVDDGPATAGHDRVRLNSRLLGIAAEGPAQRLAASVRLLEVENVLRSKQASASRRYDSRAQATGGGVHSHHRRSDVEFARDIRGFEQLPVSV